MAVPGNWTLPPSSMIRNMHQVIPWPVGSGSALRSAAVLPCSAKLPL
jgi:hypothetical protein